MGFSSERMFPYLLVGLPAMLCLSVALFKISNRIETYFDADLTGWRRTLLILSILLGAALLANCLLDLLCVWLGPPVRGVWPGEMF